MKNLEAIIYKIVDHISNDLIERDIVLTENDSGYYKHKLYQRVIKELNMFGISDEDMMSEMYYGIVKRITKEKDDER